MTAPQRLQEATFDASYDYRAGSPHLAHRHLYDVLAAQVLGRLRDVIDSGMAPSVLEIGAGHGGYTEPVLAAGANVTATEMSRPSLARLQDRFGANDRFRTLFDANGSLAVLEGERFSLVLCASVLHHIPDYITFVRRVVSRHLAEGGTFLSIQDPLWYPSVPARTRLFDRIAYLSWRVTRGDYARGARTVIRRLRHVYDETNPSDMVEYHVVRSGVDHQALADTLVKRFQRVEVSAYWSTPAAIWQRIGDRAGCQNTFLLRAEGYLGGLLPEGHEMGGG